MHATEDDWCNTPVGVREVIQRLAEQLREANELINSVSFDLINEVRRSLPQNVRQIVFVANNTTSRIDKISRALLSEGFEVVLIREGITRSESTRPDFSSVLTFRNPQEALFLALAFRPLVYHVFSERNCDVAKTLLEARPGKVVFDNDDYIGGMLPPDSIEKHRLAPLVDDERYCLENADGICSRSLELLAPRRKLRYSIRARTLLFPDYCIADSDTAEKIDDGQVRFVYAGSLAPNPKSHDNNSHLWMAQRLADLKLHYHILPASFSDIENDERYKDYFEFACTCHYFHIESSVPREQLIPALSKFDCGIVVSPTDYRDSEGLKFSAEKNKFAIANTLFDFFDAGLPVIIRQGGFARRIAVQDGAGIAGTDELFADRNRLMQTVATMKENVHRRRAALSIERHIGRLIAFYRSLEQCDVIVAQHENQRPYGRKENGIG